MALNLSTANPGTGIFGPTAPSSTGRCGSCVGNSASSSPFGHTASPRADDLCRDVADACASWMYGRWQEPPSTKYSTETFGPCSASSATSAWLSDVIDSHHRRYLSGKDA